jgi:hypothetical protein
MNALRPTALAFAALAVAGCADTPRADADFRSSVEQMVQAQTFDLVAASNPPELPPEISDAERLKNALDVYRKDVAKGASEVKQPVVFEIGTK